MIDFSPFTEAGDSTRGWTSIGPRAGLVPFETSRSISSSTVGSLAIEEMRVTEDNIILFLVSRLDFSSRTACLILGFYRKKDRAIDLPMF
jgi:hypothetical protein